MSVPEGTPQCGVCREAVEFVCTTFGKENPQFCDLRERYYTERLSSDDVVYELQKIATPTQESRLKTHLRSIVSPHG